MDLQSASPPVDCFLRIVRMEAMHSRTEGLLLGLLVAAAWTGSALLGLAPSLSQGAAEPERNGLTAEQGREALSLGREAQRRGRSDRADRLYRIAWRSATSNDAAAEALRRLHETGEASLSPDAEAVRETRELLGAGFTMRETEHFVILSDAGRASMTETGRLLERTRHQFFRAMERLEFPVIPPEHKLLCVVFSDQDMYRAFASPHDAVEAAWVGGHYATVSNRAVFYENGAESAMAELSDYRDQVRDLRSAARAARRHGRRDQAQILEGRANHIQRQIKDERHRLEQRARRSDEGKTIHEAVHLLAYNCGVQSRAHQYPFWLTEGLATSFETDNPRAAFGPDRTNETRDQAFREMIEQDRVIPLETFVALAESPDKDAQNIHDVYTQSYALLRYLFERERRGLREYLLAVMDEPPGRIAPERRRALFAEHIGQPRRVQRRWLAWWP